LHTLLDQQLLKAHADSDHAALVTLYTQAANECEQTGDIDAACFYRTHAYVFALRERMNEASELRARLASYKREE